jgi:hypothetical protein
MKPPISPMRDAGLVVAMIRANPGISLDSICARLSMSRGEIFPIVAQLIDLRIVERIEGRLFVRERKKKPKQRPSFWARLTQRAA